MSSAALRSVARAIPRATASRAFSTTVVYEKTVTETVKDGIRTVDQAVSSKIVDGINAAGMYIGHKGYNLPRFF